MSSQREAFEKWMRDEAKVIVGSSDPYPAGLEREYWKSWQAAWQAATEQGDGGSELRDARERGHPTTTRAGVISMKANDEINTEIDWDSLPDWACFAAMDYNGDWRCFGSEPMAGQVYWATLGKSLHFKTVPPSSEIHWGKTLQERPQ